MYPALDPTNIDGLAEWLLMYERKGWDEVVRKDEFILRSIKREAHCLLGESFLYGYKGVVVTTMLR